MTDAWLAGLKVGDRVMVWSTAVRRHELATVSRLTPTQIIDDTGTRYRRSDGSAIGRYAFRSLDEPTPKRLADVRQCDLASKLRSTDWHALPLATLERVAAAVEEGDSK